MLRNEDIVRIRRMLDAARKATEFTRTSKRADRILLEKINVGD